MKKSRRNKKNARLYATIAPAVLDMLPAHHARACLVLNEDGTATVIGSPHHTINDWVECDMSTGRKLRLIRLGVPHPERIPADLARLDDAALDGLLLVRR